MNQYFFISFVLTTLMESHSSVVSRAILKPLCHFGIPNSDPQTLKSVDFWRKLLSLFVVAEPREQCFEPFRMQNSQNFPGLCLWIPLERAYSAPPRLPSCTMVFLLAMHVKKLAPPKNCWIWHCIVTNTNKYARDMFLNLKTMKGFTAIISKMGLMKNEINDY